MYDILIIGSGPAGLSAALYTLRAGLSTIIIGKDGGSLEKAEKIENYFGVTGAPSGKELISTGRKQVADLGGEMITDEVTHVGWDGHFYVHTKNAILEAASVIFSTGAVRQTAKIQGISDYEGKGISYCAVCDAFFYRNKNVAIVGNGEYALHELNELLPVVNSAVVCTNGMEVKAEFPEHVDVIATSIKEVSGEDKVGQIVFKDDQKINIDGVFIALGSATAVDLARKLGAVVEGNKIMVDEKMGTSIPGAFAAGDCVGGILQVSVAVGEGAKAALSAIEFVRKQKK